MKLYPMFILCMISSIHGMNRGDRIRTEKREYNDTDSIDIRRRKIIMRTMQDMTDISRNLPLFNPSEYKPNKENSDKKDHHQSQRIARSSTMQMNKYKEHDN